MQIDFTDISYLQFGNNRQRAAYDAIVKNSIMHRLAEFDPILVGTIPIAIDIAESDLDIICSFKDATRFLSVLIENFSAYPAYRLFETTHQQQPSIVASFYQQGFHFEIFGQAVPTRQQYAYRHMLVEHKLLLEYGEAFRREIIRLKQHGFKTEPAFAAMLQLPGDPYAALLSFEKI